MTDTPIKSAATRRVTTLRWVTFVIGCYFLAEVFSTIGVLVGLLLGLPVAFDALLWELSLLWAASVALSGVLLGTLLHVRGTRQWRVAVAWMVVVFIFPVVASGVAGFVQSV